MLHVPASVAIYVYTAPADLRKGFDGLSGIVRDKFQADPLDGSLFLFFNRRRVVVPEIDAELIRVFQIPLAAMAERALQEFGEGQLQLLLFAFQLLILLMQSLDR